MRYNETKELESGHVLHRIVATCYSEVSHRQIQKGTLGGWIEKKENLQGEAWVYDDAVVTGNAYVMHEYVIVQPLVVMFLLAVLLQFRIT